jgi:hypothetical protein
MQGAIAFLIRMRTLLRLAEGTKSPTTTVVGGNVVRAQQ